MRSYTAKSKKFGEHLTAQNIPVIAVTDIGRTLYVEVPVDYEVPNTIDVGRRKIVLYSITTSTDLRTNEAIKTLRFAPVI